MEGYLWLGMKAPAVVLIIRRLRYYSMQPDERIHPKRFIFQLMSLYPADILPFFLQLFRKIIGSPFSSKCAL